MTRFVGAQIFTWFNLVPDKNDVWSEPALLLVVETRKVAVKCWSTPRPVHPAHRRELWKLLPTSRLTNPFLFAKDVKSHDHFFYVMEKHKRYRDSENSLTLESRDPATRRRNLRDETHGSQLIWWYELPHILFNARG